MKTQGLALAGVLMLLCAGPVAETARAQDPFLGEVRLVGFNFCPRGWVEAAGQLLSISNNQALFALYGTIYGGDGRTTFALPDLRGRTPVSMGQGPGLSSYPIGQAGGVETVTLTQQEMPAHDHTVVELTNQNGASPGLVVRSGGGEQTTATSSAGGSQAHENRPPHLAMLYCVALTGIFPSRN